MLVLGFSRNLRGLSNPTAQTVIPVNADTMHLAVNHRLRFDEAVLAVVTKGLQLAQPYPLFNQIAPRVVGIFLIAPLLNAVVFNLIKLAGVEVQAVGCSVVAKLFAID
jgi:hypothetical protein